MRSERNGLEESDAFEEESGLQAESSTGGGDPGFENEGAELSDPFGGGRGFSRADEAALDLATDEMSSSAAAAGPFDEEDPITEVVRQILQSHCKPYSDSRKLKDMGGGNAGVRALIAHDIDAAFGDQLNPRFQPEDVRADDNLASLSARVAGRLTA